MRTDFSEFSYGYALVEEIATSLKSNMKATPIFPSLIEEGKDGGGYDVKFKFKLPGLPLLIQFKRPDVMVSVKAKEISHHNLNLNLPFYRFHIRSSSTSKQHDALLGHDDGKRLVYYAAPRFHEIIDFDNFYFGRSVIENSIFIRPSIIGTLSSEPHYVAYGDNQDAWLFSENPTQIAGVKQGRLVEEDFEERLLIESRPLQDCVVDDLASIVAELGRDGTSVRSSPRIEGLTGPRRDLARLSELAQIYLNSQLFIIQRKSSDE